MEPVELDRRPQNDSGLGGADFRGSNLSSAKFTQEQLDSVRGNSSTILPIRGVTWILRAPHFIRLKRPEHWDD